MSMRDEDYCQCGEPLGKHQVGMCPACRYEIVANMEDERRHDENGAGGYML